MFAHIKHNTFKVHYTRDFYFTTTRLSILSIKAYVTYPADPVYLILPALGVDKVNSII